MNDKLILNLGGKVVEVTQDDNNRYSLNDLYKASGAGRTKNPSSFFRYVGAGVEVKKAWELRKRENSFCGDMTTPTENGGCENTTGEPELTCENFDNSVVQVKVNRATVTFAPLTIVYKYAAFISKEFEDSVYKAFTLITQGRVDEAMGVASSVACTPEAKDKAMKLRDELNSIISENYSDMTQAHSLFNGLVCVASTGFRPKQLTDKSMSALDWILKNDHYEALLAYIATADLVCELCLNETPYHTVASVLKVQTSRNEKLLKRRKVRA